METAINQDWKSPESKVDYTSRLNDIGYHGLTPGKHPYPNGLEDAEAAEQRIATFHEQGQPTLEYLTDSGVHIVTIDATQSPDEVWLDLLKENTVITRRVL